MRGSADGGVQEVEDAAATKKNSERKSPAAKRSQGRQPVITRYLSKIAPGAMGNDVLETNAKSPEGEQGALKDINTSGGGLRRVEKSQSDLIPVRKLRALRINRQARKKDRRKRIKKILPHLP